MEKSHLYSIVEKLEREELQELVNYFNDRKKRNKNADPRPEKTALSLESEKNLSFRLLALWILNQERLAEISKNPLNDAKFSRNFACLREKINYELVKSLPCTDLELSHQKKPAQAVVNVEDKVSRAIKLIYGFTVGRNCVEEEIKIWKNNFANGLGFHEFLLMLADSPEAKKLSGSNTLFPEKSDEEFIMLVYEIILGRGCIAKEVSIWERHIASGAIDRTKLLQNLLLTKSEENRNDVSSSAVKEEQMCTVMGTKKTVTYQDWVQKKESMSSAERKKHREFKERFIKRFHIKKTPQILVTAIASLYKGGDFVEAFMDNITNQNKFEDYCELIIVDADSPENEYETIKRYLSKFKNIQYLRQTYRVGIYDAWNIGAKAANGIYLTNTNLDDNRRHDSLEIQLSTLENLPFIDIVYQDFYYTFDPNMNFEEIAEMGIKSSLPLVTPHSLMEMNSPHNGPMWRKSLHDELGYFNTDFKTAGDYEFWLRCCAAGKCFYKINDPHIAYYQNPKGLSTMPGGRGVIEAKEAHRLYGRVLASDYVLMSRSNFCKSVGINSERVGNLNRFQLTQKALRNHAQKEKYSAY